ncbi:MAG TPA: glycosyltransferase family 4 protein [Gemmatimonadaceae bacterium]|nr:glycosyltransferase family 4 protein [Gemmatimonadaceae bacterium]
MAIVTEYYYPHLGGITEHVHHLALELRRRGHHVDVITSHIPGGEELPNVVRIGDSLIAPANGSLARVTVGRGLRRAMRDAFERGRYDVVHVHAPLTPSLPMLAVEEARCALVGTFHAYFDYSVAYIFGRRYFQRLMDRIDAAIAVSTAARDSAARYFDAEWTIIPNGVDTDLFHPAAAPPPLLEDGTPTVLYVGRFDPRNGLPALLEAFRLLRADGRDARLVVVGDGPERDRYRALADGDPNVHFAGRVPDGLPGYYAGCTVYACPTVLGSFGITLLEAMACGAPIACYDTPGFRNVVRDGREALMTTPGDTAALARSLARLLDDDTLRARMAAAGRTRALGYAWPRVTDQVLGIYARALESAPAPLDARRRLAVQADDRVAVEGMATDDGAAAGVAADDITADDMAADGAAPGSARTGRA